MALCTSASKLIVNFFVLQVFPPPPSFYNETAAKGKREVVQCVLCVMLKVWKDQEQRPDRKPCLESCDLTPTFKVAHALARSQRSVKFCDIVNLNWAGRSTPPTHTHTLQHTPSQQCAFKTSPTCNCCS